MKKFGIIFLLVILFGVTACERKNTYLGYVEGRLTYISSPFSGKLMTIFVERGREVKTGDLLFQLEQEPESSDVKAALASVNEAIANLADKSKGDRPSELEAVMAQVEQARAQVDYAKKDAERKRILVKENVMEQNQLDLANQNLKVAQGALQEYQENLTTANLAARTDQIKAVQAQLQNAEANLEKAQWSLQQKTVDAPVDAEVFDTYYRAGEQVPANQAVLSILAPADIKIVFFVDEPSLGRIKVGKRVHVDCDGCRSGMTAVIRFISPSAEYTPPVIYSRSARTKLVYEVEAQFDREQAKKHHVRLNPGEPVEVVVKL